MNTVLDYDEKVMVGVRALSPQQKKELMVIGLMRIDYKKDALLVKLAENSVLLRANIHKTDMTSQEFHILEELLDEVCDFSRTVSRIWENEVIRKMT